MLAAILLPMQHVASLHGIGVHLWEVAKIKSWATDIALQCMRYHGQQLSLWGRFDQYIRNTAKTLHDSDQEVVQLELRCEYINISSACGTGGTVDFML